MGSSIESCSLARSMNSLAPIPPRRLGPAAFLACLLMCGISGSGQSRRRASQLVGDTAWSNHAARGRSTAGTESGSLVHERRVCNSPPAVDVTDNCCLADRCVRDEDLVEHGSPRHLSQRPNVNSVLVHVERKVSDALVLGHFGVCSGQQHSQVGNFAHRRPNLLTVDDPLVAVFYGTGL